MSILDDLINGLIGTPTPIPQDEPIQKYSGFNIAQAPPPKPLTAFEKQQLRTAITSGGLTDLAGIFLGQAPQGRSNAALQRFAGAEREIDDQARATAQWNAGQENQFGRGAQAQAAAMNRALVTQAGQTGRANERNDIAALRDQLAHQDRVGQLEVAERNARTAEERARVSEELGRERNEIARLRAQMDRERLERTTRGKPLDRVTRDTLENAKTGGTFAREALDFFNKTGGTAGGPVAGRMPTFMLPKTTQQFNTLRVKAEAQLRKYMAGSAVTPTELVALEPLLVGLNGTANQIRESMKGIADFFDTKRKTLLDSLETTGIAPDIADEVRRQFGEPTDTPAHAPIPPSPGTRVPSLPPGTEESSADKLKRAKAAAGIP